MQTMAWKSLEYVNGATLLRIAGWQLSHREQDSEFPTNKLLVSRFEICQSRL